MGYTGLAESSHTFSVKVVDDLGNDITEPAHYTWTVGVPPLNTTLPDFINKGKGSFTYNTHVTLSISATNDKGIAGYYASENPDTPDASAPGWVPVKSVTAYAKDVDFALSERAGRKRVYVWFKDSAGYISDVQSDTIYRFSSKYVLYLFLFLQAVLIL